MAKRFGALPYQMIREMPVLTIFFREARGSRSTSRYKEVNHRVAQCVALSFLKI